MGETTDLDNARMAVGLSEARFADLGSAETFTHGLPIVCKCVRCGTLFVSRSHDLADQEFICRGDCGCVSEPEE